MAESQPVDSTAKSQGDFLSLADIWGGRNIHHGHIDIPTCDVCPHCVDESVLLYDPPYEDIICNTTGYRYIFNNSFLTSEEEAHLERFVVYFYGEYMSDPNNVALVDVSQVALMQPEFLRFLHSAKFNYAHAADLILANFKFRTGDQLPASTDDIREELENGCLYWFGRDKKCRPTIIADVSKLEPLSFEKIVKLVVFCFEFFLRFLVVGGKSENYTLIVDCGNKSVMQLPLQVIMKLFQTMHSKYRARLYKAYFVNSDKLSDMLLRPMFALMPETTALKVQVLRGDFRGVLSPMYNVNQLEEKFGGTHPSLSASFYPFRFSPNCTGHFIQSGNSTAATISMDPMFLFGTLMYLKSKPRKIQTSRNHFNVVASASNSGSVDEFEQDSDVLGIVKLHCESWLDDIDGYILTRRTAKYIASKRPELRDKVQANVVETIQDLYKFTNLLNGTIGATTAS